MMLSKFSTYPSQYKLYTIRCDDLINYKHNSLYNTPLFFATKNHHHDIIKFSLENGAKS
jgi:ankyrin repeat protein